MEKPPIPEWLDPNLTMRSTLNDTDWAGIFMVLLLAMLGIGAVIGGLTGDWMPFLVGLAGFAVLNAVMFFAVGGLIAIEGLRWIVRLPWICFLVVHRWEPWFLSTIPTNFGSGMVVLQRVCSRCESRQIRWEGKRWQQVAESLYGTDRDFR